MSACKCRRGLEGEFCNRTKPVAVIRAPSVVSGGCGKAELMLDGRSSFGFSGKAASFDWSASIVCRKKLTRGAFVRKACDSYHAPGTFDLQNKDRKYVKVSGKQMLDGLKDWSPSKSLAADEEAVFEFNLTVTNDWKQSSTRSHIVSVVDEDVPVVSIASPASFAISQGDNLRLETAFERSMCGGGGASLGYRWEVIRPHHMIAVFICRRARCRCATCSLSAAPCALAANTSSQSLLERSTGARRCSALGKNSSAAVTSLSNLPGPWLPPKRRCCVDSTKR